MAKVVLATIGSLGDLYPFIAIGLALERRGIEVLLAVPQDHVDLVRHAGLDAAAVLPAFATITAKLGMSNEEVVARAFRDQPFLVDKILLGALPDSAIALDQLCEGASAVVGSLFMFAAPIIAEKRVLPFISVLLQPMTMFSAWDPPATSDFRAFKRAPVGRIGALWNRAAYWLGGRALRARFGGRIDTTRSAHGLGPRRRPVLLDPGGDPVLSLCCWSERFAPLQRDAPRYVKATGFPMFDSGDQIEQGLDAGLAAFLAAGRPPFVFTLGSVAVAAPGNFYTEAVRAVRRLGERAVLLTGEADPGEHGPQIMTRRYVAHSLLFKHAAAVVHHGGIGTTAQALRAGVPQLVVPHMGDQNDNAARLKRLGVAEVMRARDFTADRVAPSLRRIVADNKMRKWAATFADSLASEAGGQEAAAAIEHAIRRSRVNTWAAAQSQ